MPQRSRNQLYPEFRNGEKPDENDFRNLIDSFYSKEDDNAISLKDSAGTETIYLSGGSGDLTLGGNGRDGDLYLKDTSDRTNIHLNGSLGDMRLGGDGQGGNLTLRTSANVTTINLDGTSGNVTLGGGNQDGDLTLRSSSGQTAISLNGSSADLTLGGNGQEGDLYIKNTLGTTTILLSGTSTAGEHSIFEMYDSSNRQVFEVDSSQARVQIGGNGRNGILVIPYGNGNSAWSLGYSNGSADLEINRSDGVRMFDFEASSGSAWRRGGTAWIDLSDKRIKKNIKPYKKGLENIKKLDPVTFQHNGQGGTIEDDKMYCGLVAQDVMQEFPEMIRTKALKLKQDDKEETELLGIDVSDLNYIFINAIKELAEKVETLGSQLKKK